MKSYFELLEKALDAKSDEIVTPVAKTLGVKRKEAAEKIGELSIDDALDLVDAVDRDDDGYVMLAMDDEDDKDEKLAEANLGQPYRQPNQPQGRIPPGQPQAPVRPGQTQPNDPRQPMLAQQPGAPVKTSPMMAEPGIGDDVAARDQFEKPAPGTVKRTQGTVGPIGEQYSIGDEVVADGGEAVVKVPAAGRDGMMVGVLKDGNMRMVNRKKLKHMKKIDEGVLGMTGMPSLQRMMELAGIPSDKKDVETEAPSKPWEKKEAKTEPKAKPQSEIQGKAEDALRAQRKEDELKSVGIEVHNVQTGETQTVATTAPASKAAIASPVGEAPAQVDPRSEIMTALDSIERLMPELKVGDYKDVRARLDKISNMIFESQMNRRRKV